MIVFGTTSYGKNDRAFYLNPNHKVDKNKFFNAYRAGGLHDIIEWKPKKRGYFSIHFITHGNNHEAYF
jgi:hypothetical protein